MILRLLEGDLAPVACVGDSGECSRADRCVTADVYKQIKDAVDQVVDHITLADLVRNYREKGECEYCI
jgi:DNA-binding IscR family transcriptional regulator